MPKRRFSLDRVNGVRYPTGEEVPVKFKIIIQVRIGIFSDELPIYVADIVEDCLLGADFLSAVNLEDIFSPFFEENLKKVGLVSSCSRMSSWKNEIPQSLKDFFVRESMDLTETQKNLFTQFLIEFQDVFSEEIVAGN